MNSPAVDIMAILESSAFGLGTVGTDLFISSAPVSPDNCATSYDTGGFDPDAGTDYYRPTVQIRVRNLDYNAGFAKGFAILQALHGQHGLTEGGSRYIGIWAMGDVAFLNYDDNNRALFSVNVRIHRTPTT